MSKPITRLHSAACGMAAGCSRSKRAIAAASANGLDGPNGDEDLVRLQEELLQKVLRQVAKVIAASRLS